MSPLSQYILIGKALALLGAIALICFQSSQIHKWHQQTIKLSEKLHQISDKKNEQKQRTEENIKVVTRIVHDADERAKRVEQAPPAKDCKTKPEVLQADL